MARASTLEFALLKFDLKGKSVPCLPIRAAGAGEKVWSLGYPGKALTFNADGQPRTIDVDEPRPLYISQGTARDRFQEVQTLFPGHGDDSPIGDAFDESAALFSDARVSAGMSGGPLLGEDGAVLGINVFGLYYRLKTASEKAVFVRTEAVYSEVARLLGAARARRAFDCRL